jgi:hypothetical protein
VRKIKQSLFLVGLFALGLFLFDAFGGIKPVNKPAPKFEERVGRDLFGFWMGEDSHLVISTAGEDQFHFRETHQNREQENDRIFTLSSQKENSFKARFKETGEDFEIDVNKELRELTVIIDGNKKVYQATVITPEQYLVQTWPDGNPNFVRNEDLNSIDWERKAVEFDGFFGNEGKSGIIGDRSQVQNQKWMWHLWGVENPEGKTLTVVGVHREKRAIHKAMANGWSVLLGGPNNGADAHVPSSVTLRDERRVGVPPLCGRGIVRYPCNGNQGMRKTALIGRGFFCGLHYFQGLC